MSLDSILGGLVRNSSGGTVKHTFTLQKSSNTTTGLFRFPSHDTKVSGGGVFSEQRKTEVEKGKIEVEDGSDDEDIKKNRKDKYKRRVREAESCYNVTNVGPDNVPTTYVCAQDGNDSCYIMISGGSGGYINVETVGVENWVGRREEEKGFKSKLNTLRLASNFHTDEGTRLKMLGGNNPLASRGSGGAKLMSLLDKKSRGAGDDEDDIMADVMGKGEVRRKKTKKEMSAEGTTKFEVADDVKVVQSKSAREELLRDSVFANDVEGEARVAFGEDGYMVTGGGNDEEFGAKMEFSSAQMGAEEVENYNEIEGKKFGFSGTDKVEQDIVRQGDFGVLYDDVDFDPDLYGNDDVDQEENEIMEGAEDDDFDPLKNESDESEGEDEEAKGLRNKKGTLAMLKRARGEAVDDEEIVGKAGHKKTAYKTDYDDVAEDEESEEDEKRKREEVEEEEDRQGKRRKVDLMETDELGRRKLTKEAVRNEIWLNGGKITMNNLCKTFGIKRKDKGTERLEEFLRIVGELSKKEKGQLVLKQHYQNA